MNQYKIIVYILKDTGYFAAQYGDIRGSQQNNMGRDACVKPHTNLLTAPYFPVLGSKTPCIVYITSTTFSEMCLK